MKTETLTYFAFAIFIISGFYFAEKNRNQYQEQLYQNQLLEQNLNSNIQVQNNMQTKEDSLKNRIRLLENNIITKTDTITIIKTKVDSILYTQTSDSEAVYNFYDKICYPRFELKIDMFLSLLNYKVMDSKFSYQYIEFPDTISVVTFFDNESKLLYSNAFVNGIEFKSENNMYERVYKSIYSDFIGNINNDEYEWYDRIGLSIGIGYNAYGETLPYLGLGYNYNFRELKEIFK